MVIDAAQYFPGALSPLHKSFLILGNAARCAPLKIPHILFFLRFYIKKQVHPLCLERKTLLFQKDGIYSQFRG